MSRVCESCDRSRLDIEFDRGEHVCQVCAARQIISLRGLMGKPSFMDGEDRLRELAKKAEQEEAEGAISPPLSSRFHPGLTDCTHCHRVVTPPYFWYCSRGYRQGLCAGVRHGHYHASCTCYREDIYDA